MKRIIKFRAIKDDPASFEFVYGDLIYEIEPISKCWVPRIQSHCDFIFTSCLPNTEQQYTGMSDEENMEIYEGDIVKEIYKIGYSLYEVCFGEYSNGWYLKGMYNFRKGKFSNLETIYPFGENLYPFNSSKPKIVGNILKNEYLLKTI
jgi:uncharacterized phage protein (TIGR01671 family)